MSFRPQGIPVTNVPGMPMTVGFNPTLISQPVMMPIGVQPTMIVRQPMQVQSVMMANQQLNRTGGQIVGAPVHDATGGPPVTVFVGNISEKATDTLVRQILMKCGTVNNWKRVQGASGKLQAFGFCEFKEPDSALRALRLLQGYTLGDKGLLVKVDGNAQNIIEQWKKRSGIKQDSDGMDVLSTQVKNKDEAVRQDLKILLRDYATDLFVEEPSITPTENGGDKKEEKDKKIIEKNESETKPKKSDAKEDKGPIVIKDEPETDRNRSRHRSRSSEKERRDDRRRDDRDRRDRHRSRERTHERRERDRTRERTRDRSEERRRNRRSEERRKDEDELLERRRLERKIREKDSAYQERLVGWEARERRKGREWERIESRDNENRRQMHKEARRLRDFLENYDDEKDDRKFYFGSGSAFQRRLENRDKEKEFDDKDRRKEEEEIGSLRRKLAAEGHPDPDDAISKVIKEAEEVWKPFILPETRRKRGKSQGTTTESESSSSEEEEENEKSDESDDKPLDEQIRKHSNEVAEQTHHTSDDDDHDGMEMDMGDENQHETNRAPLRLPGLENKFKATHSGSNSPAFNYSQTTTSTTEKRRNVASVFQEEEEEDSKPTQTKKRKTVPSKEVRSADEKKRLVKALIERIPTDRGALFAYPIRWDYLTEGSDSLMEKRIIPWIKKKLIEIIGEDEPTLVEFVTSRLRNKTKPEYILQEIKVALEEEADMFVVKLWRLLIYETEARYEGITQ